MTTDVLEPSASVAEINRPGARAPGFDSKPDSGAGEGQAWRQLVTDGHKLAARARAAWGGGVVKRGAIAVVAGVVLLGPFAALQQVDGRSGIFRASENWGRAGQGLAALVPSAVPKPLAAGPILAEQVKATQAETLAAYRKLRQQAEAAAATVDVASLPQAKDLPDAILLLATELHRGKVESFEVIDGKPADLGKPLAPGAFLRIPHPTVKDTYLWAVLAATQSYDQPVKPRLVLLLSERAKTETGAMGQIVALLHSNDMTDLPRLRRADADDIGIAPFGVNDLGAHFSSFLP